MTADDTRLWGGRFQALPAASMMRFTQSIGFDVALAREDAAVLGAHARALFRAGLLEQSEAESVATEARAVADEIAAGTFLFVDADEDVHTAIERALIERLPMVGPRSRAGLSRNDRVAAAFRLWCMRETRSLAEAVCSMVDALVAKAAADPDTVMPGYTHLQRAQPVRVAHHFLAHAHALSRDAARLADAADRTAWSPLGAGALAGSTLGLDTATSAHELGFAGVMANSLDAVAARDFAVEIASACAMLAVHCSRIGEEIVLWTSTEFSFAELDDAYATGSSLMPQKKNPDVAELARGKAGRIIGNLAGLLATLKSLPLAYNRDLQEDKEPMLDTIGQLHRLIPALKETLTTMRMNNEVVSRAADSGMLLATDLAEYLVLRGVAFRDAHEVVGRVVQRAIAVGRDLADLSLAELQGFSDRFGPDVHEALRARVSVDRRQAPGPSLDSVNAQIAALRDVTASLRTRLSHPTPA